MYYFQKDNCYNKNIDKCTLYTLAWDKLCRSKCEGSLGIKKTEYINAAFLAQ